MFKVPQKYRITKGIAASDISYGNNGAFMVPLRHRSTACIIASDGEGWEHVSVHILECGNQRTPTWAEMCKIKDLFWSKCDCVMQLHPPESNYVNKHKHTLHLWKPINEKIPQPDIILV